ncbi:hypothetical protein C4D60_Mb06t12770 [Musa balbisiana]|uniref:Dirigent protein n=1 Tax=Musa balbisiana TaxID=52838 RepID=A0A4S8IMM7_MUSBA|nr:hypothetical protein C4D60_Mb06t12770 [Musa balbisiana]
MASSSPRHYSALSSLFLLFFTLLAAAVAFPVTSEFELGPRNRTYFRVYFHETFIGPDNTTLNVVKKNRPNGFGDVFIFDTVLRVGPEANSTYVGKAQGVTFVVSRRDVSLLIPLVLVFTEGEFANSTLTIIGKMDGAGKADRAIIGGTGRFRFASGNAVSEVISSSAEGLIAVFDVYVVHHAGVRPYP